jgi:GNAT superfamily N-acetyltransferase
MRKKSGMKLTIRPVTPDLWLALEDLFGKWGASNGCWCMYWRLGGAYRGRREENKERLRKIVKRGPSPGLLAFDGDLPVGWCQLTPRDALPWLDQMWWFQRVDDLPVWSISCFFVRRDYRRQGIMTQLIAAAVKTAKRARTSALEAYPIDTSASKSSSNIFVRHSVDVRARWLQGSRSPRAGSPDHAPRSEGTPAIKLLDADDCELGFLDGELVTGYPETNGGLWHKRAPSKGCRNVCLLGCCGTGRKRLGG